MPIKPPTKKSPVTVDVTNPEKPYIVDPADALILDPAELEADLKKLIKGTTFTNPVKQWLDTGSPELNAALGSRKRGLAYGKITELSGLNHGGKTAIGLVLASMAQQDNAAVGEIDLERSRDEVWETKLGLEPSQVLAIRARLVEAKVQKEDGAVSIFKKKVKKREHTITGLPLLQSAEDLFSRAEAAMYLMWKRGFRKQYWLIDSIAMIQTAKVIAAGVDQDMNTHLSRAIFLSDNLPRWAALADEYGAMVVLINQLRMKQGIVFGDPFQSPGGMALEHACSIRARVRRAKNGRLLKNGHVIGIVGVVSNTKNKAGGGSVEQAKVGYKIKWNHTPAQIQFFPADQADDVLKEQ